MDSRTVARSLRGSIGMLAMDWLMAPSTLEAAAEVHGRDMAKGGFFSHTGSDGSSAGKRAKRQGFKFCLIAENIAKGQRTPEQVMNSWTQSKGHRKNMLQKKAREIGVIRQDGNIWVMVLGTRKGKC